MKIEKLADHDNNVIAVFDITAVGRASGIETKRRNAILYELQDGLITKMDHYTTEEEANAALAAYVKNS